MLDLAETDQRNIARFDGAGTQFPRAQAGPNNGKAQNKLVHCRPFYRVIRDHIVDECLDELKLYP